MKTFKVTTQGQVTLSAELLKHLGVRPGDELVASELPNGTIELRAAPRGNISNAFGFLRTKNGPSLSIDKMNEIIAASWAGER